MRARHLLNHFRIFLRHDIENIKADKDNVREHTASFLCSVTGVFGNTSGLLGSWPPTLEQPPNPKLSCLLHWELLNNC